MVRGGKAKPPEKAKGRWRGREEGSVGSKRGVDRKVNQRVLKVPTSADFHECWPCCAHWSGRLNDYRRKGEGKRGGEAYVQLGESVQQAR